MEGALTALASNLVGGVEAVISACFAPGFLVAVVDDRHTFRQ